MTERTPEDVVRGILRIHIGDDVRPVPTLKIKASEEWVRFAAEKLGGGVLHLAADESGAAAFSELATETMLELVLAYDQTSALGGREYLEEHADPGDLYAALRQMGKVALPFVNDMAEFLHLAMARFPNVVMAAVAASTPPKSTSGPSPTGASTETPSSSASTATN